MQDEIVRIVRKDLPTGYCTTRRSWMKPGDVEYFEPQTGTRPDNSEPGIVVDSQGLDPIKQKQAAPEKPTNKKKVKK
jgi:hypothetical protein